MNPDRLAELEEERRFLLESIRDLDREREAGDVDVDDFVALRDGYVARAAAVLREIEDGKSRLPARPTRPLWRRLVVPAITLLIAVMMGWAVASFAGERLPGQTISGGPEIDEVSATLSQARQLLRQGDLLGSIQRYDEVLVLEPDNVEAATYSSWVRAVVGQQSGDMAVLAEGLAGLEDAVAIDPTYADSICLLSVAKARFVVPPDLDGARAAGDACLALNPPAEMTGMIEAMLTEL
ncbi:MAG TPA: hypothetical protein DCR14_12545 [Acidimicrobiaceae bacterium]|nr:hypothetical protein [Acidimicrobiaceae bacterium]